MVYNIAKVGDKQVGAIMKQPPEAKNTPPMWGSYVTVDDIDTTTQDTEKLGGKVLIAPRDIPDVGRFSVIQDPQGATLTLITYSNC